MSLQLQEFYYYQLELSKLTSRKDILRALACDQAASRMICLQGSGSESKSPLSYHRARLLKTPQERDDQDHVSKHHEENGAAFHPAD